MFKDMLESSNDFKCADEIRETIEEEEPEESELFRFSFDGILLIASKYDFYVCKKAPSIDLIKFSNSGYENTYLSFDKD